MVSCGGGGGDDEFRMSPVERTDLRIRVIVAATDISEVKCGAGPRIGGLKMVESAEGLHTSVVGLSNAVRRPSSSSPSCMPGVTAPPAAVVAVDVPWDITSDSPADREQQLEHELTEVLLPTHGAGVSPPAPVETPLAASPGAFVVLVPGYGIPKAGVGELTGVGELKRSGGGGKGEARPPNPLRCCCVAAGSTIGKDSSTSCSGVHCLPPATVIVTSLIASSVFFSTGGFVSPCVCV